MHKKNKQKYYRIKKILSVQKRVNPILLSSTVIPALRLSKDLAETKNTNCLSIYGIKISDRFSRPFSLVDSDYRREISRSDWKIAIITVISRPFVRNEYRLRGVQRGRVHG